MNRLNIFRSKQTRTRTPQIRTSSILQTDKELDKLILDKKWRKAAVLADEELYNKLASELYIKAGDLSSAAKSLSYVDKKAASILYEKIGDFYGAWENATGERKQRLALRAINDKNTNEGHKMHIALKSYVPKKIVEKIVREETKEIEQYYHPSIVAEDIIKLIQKYKLSRKEAFVCLDWIHGTHYIELIKKYLTKAEQKKDIIMSIDNLTETKDKTLIKDNQPLFEFAKKNKWHIKIVEEYLKANRLKKAAVAINQFDSDDLAEIYKTTGDLMLYGKFLKALAQYGTR